MPVIRVASWNIWVFGKRNYKGITRFIKENKVDVIGIQEAAIYYDKKPKLDMARSIANEIGYHYVFFPALDIKPNYIMGNAIISRFPIVKARSYKLTPPWIKYDGQFENEMRILVASKIKVNNIMINFLTTHLQVTVRFKSTKVRQFQIKKIISVMNKLDGKAILTGDFNSLLTNPELKLLSKRLNRIGGTRPTWTTVPFSHKDWHINKLEYRLDNIFISKNLKYRYFKIGKSKISDHLPIMADVSIA